MKLPLTWLNEFLDLEIDSRDFMNRLTMSGTKVEDIKFLGASIENVVTGEIVDIQNHPNADKLCICILNINDNSKIKIVTGATNVYVGAIVPVALNNSILPGNIKITSSDFRGVKSDGMLCSHVELGISENHIPGANANGILILPPATPIGRDIRDVLGLNEYVAEFEITSNRPDCLSAIGIAREVSATYNTHIDIKRQDIALNNVEKIDDLLSVKLNDITGCKRYSAMIFKNVKIGDSPDWIRRRLIFCGVRPINNIVDITNYVMLEYGQPMHAFDYDTIQGSEIIIRKAVPNERIQTLDGNEIKLDESCTVIADKNRSIALAGVMGGKNTEITQETKTIVLESACFNSSDVRYSSKKFGIRSESSIRFEKGIDIDGCITALQRACQIIMELGIAEPMFDYIDISNYNESVRKIRLDYDKINSILGTSIESTEMNAILERLQFSVNNDIATIPVFRDDVSSINDIAEEVGRIYGYDNIPTNLNIGTVSHGMLTPYQKFEKDLHSICRACGFDEIITSSFIGMKAYKKSGIENTKSVELINPIGEEFALMKNSTLPGMMSVIARNYSYRAKNVSLFEISKIYIPNGDSTQPIENSILSIASYGKLDFFEMKGILECIFREFRIRDIEFRPLQSNKSYHPYKIAAIYIAEKYIGVIGNLHPSIIKNYSISTDVLSAEIDIGAIYEYIDINLEYVTLPKFPYSTRDISIVCSSEIYVSDIQKCIIKSGGDRLKLLKLFDIYTGDQIEEGKKSISYSLTFGDNDKTLNDIECDDIVNEILRNLDNTFSAKLRL